MMSLDARGQRAYFSAGEAAKGEVAEGCDPESGPHLKGPKGEGPSPPHPRARGHPGTPRTPEPPGDQPTPLGVVRAPVGHDQGLASRRGDEEIGDPGKSSRDNHPPRTESDRFTIQRVSAWP